MQTKSFGLITTVTTHEGKVVTLAKVRKDFEWFYKMVKGQKAHRDDVKRSRIVEDLIRDTLAAYKALGQAADASPDAKSAVADEDIDPMEDLEPVDAGGPGKKWSRKRRTGDIVELTVPEVPRCAFPSSTSTKTVLLMVHRSSLWVSVEYLPWLLEYAHGEVSHGNVTMEVQSSESPDPNCEVPNVHVKWDWASGDNWEAAFVAGPLDGQRFTSSVSALTKEKWQKASGERMPFGDTYERANPEQKRQAALELLKMHCRHVASEA